MTRSSEFVWTFHIEKVDGTKEDVKSQTVQQPNRKSRTEFIVYALESLFQERLFCGTTQVSGKHKESHRFSKTGQLLGGAPPLEVPLLTFRSWQYNLVDFSRGHHRPPTGKELQSDLYNRGIHVYCP